MCIDILKSPVAAFAAAKRKRNVNKTLVVLAEASALLAVAVTLVTLKALPTTNIASTAIFVFLLAFLSVMLIGWVVDIVAKTLGGKGNYLDGLTTVTYSSVFLAAGLLLSSVLLLLPLAGTLSVISLLLSGLVMLPAFAAGFSSFYRGIKEMYKTDMITALVTVSVTTLTIVTVVQLVAVLGLANTSLLSLAKV